MMTFSQLALATNSVSRMMLPTRPARMGQYPMIPTSIRPCRVDYAAHWRTTSYRVKPLWLSRVIDWAWARYGPSHERSRRQTAHRWVENRTCALSKSWPEYWTNHGVDYPAPYHRPGNPPNWIRTVEYRAHRSAIKRPAPVQRPLNSSHRRASDLDSDPSCSQETLFMVLNTLQLRSDNLTGNQPHAHLFGALSQLP